MKIDVAGRFSGIGNAKTIGAINPSWGPPPPPARTLTPHSRLESFHEVSKVPELFSWSEEAFALMKIQISAVETDKVKLVLEIESFDMSSDEFDKETRSSDGLQPKEAGLSCVHALNALHLHGILMCM
ncbi:hypothetical protein Tco_0126440 [Tanacetum coccineum]